MNLTIEQLIGNDDIEQQFIDEPDTLSEREAIDTALYGKQLYDIYGDEPDLLDYTHFI